MQATVSFYDAVSGAGTCVLDDGTELDVAPGALSGSGLRHVRPGQRVSVTTGRRDDGTTYVTALRIVGVTP